MRHNFLSHETARDRPHKGWTLALASLGLFMVALDTLVVTTALPVLRVDLGASIADLEWTVNAYNLSFACLLLTGAALGDRFGRRRMFTVGLLVFTVASAVAALSPTVVTLIAARALQGAGAAMVPLTLTLISEAFPLEKRGMAIGLWGGIAGLAVAAGPVVGGAVIDGIDWHWIFWLNVPIGLALIPLSARRLSESFGPRPQPDIVGLVLAGAGLLGVTWGLVRANTVGWGSVEVIAALVAGAALVAVFIDWERRTRSPMLPLALFRHRAFASANPWRRSASPQGRTARFGSSAASSVSPFSRPSSTAPGSTDRPTPSSAGSSRRCGWPPASRRPGSSRRCSHRGDRVPQRPHPSPDACLRSRSRTNERL